MPKTGGEGLTAQQAKWFASVQANLERNTGKSMDEWLAIAASCPETGHRARLKWLKDNHGLMQNYASQVLSRLDGSQAAWNEPDALREALWAQPEQRAIYEAVADAVSGFDGLITGQRKGYSAWSRSYQFCAVRPVKGGCRLGLAVEPSADPRLELAKPNEGWSERLKATLPLTAPEQVDAGVRALLRQAVDRS